MKEWFKARNIWGAAINSLSDEEAGRLAKAIWTYTMTGEETDIDGAGKGILAMIMMTLSQDEERDGEISEKRAKAGRMGAHATNASKCQQESANDSNCRQMPANADNKNKSKNKNIEKESDKELSARFDRFWSAYPRHVAKQEALKRFEKLNPSDDLLETMLKAIEKQKGSEQWTKDNGQYIPHPSTWLNQSRWEDELPAAGTSGKIVNAQGYSQRNYEDEDAAALERMLRGVTA